MVWTVVYSGRLDSGRLSWISRIEPEPIFQRAPSISNSRREGLKFSGEVIVRCSSKNYIRSRTQELLLPAQPILREEPPNGGRQHAPSMTNLTTKKPAFPPAW